MAGSAIRGKYCLYFWINVAAAAKNRNRHGEQSIGFLPWLSTLAYLLTLICGQSGAILIQIKNNQQQAAK